MNAELKMIMCRKIWKRGLGGRAIRILGSEAAARGLVVDRCLEKMQLVRFPLTTERYTFQMRTLTQRWTVTVYVYQRKNEPQCWVQRGQTDDRVRSLQWLEQPHLMLCDAVDMPDALRAFIEQYYGPMAAPTPICFGRR